MSVLVQPEELIWDDLMRKNWKLVFPAYANYPGIIHPSRWSAVFNFTAAKCFAFAITYIDVQRQTEWPLKESTDLKRFYEHDTDSAFVIAAPLILVTVLMGLCFAMVVLYWCIVQRNRITEDTMSEYEACKREIRKNGNKSKRYIPIWHRRRVPSIPVQLDCESAVLPSTAVFNDNTQKTSTSPRPFKSGLDLDDLSILRLREPYHLSGTNVTFMRTRAFHLYRRERNPHARSQPNSMPRIVVTDVDEEPPPRSPRRVRFRRDTFVFFGGHSRPSKSDHHIQHWQYPTTIPPEEAISPLDERNKLRRTALRMLYPSPRTIVEDLQSTGQDKELLRFLQFISEASSSESRPPSPTGEEQPQASSRLNWIPVIPYRATSREKATTDEDQDVQPESERFFPIIRKPIVSILKMSRSKCHKKRVRFTPKPNRKASKSLQRPYVAQESKSCPCMWLHEHFPLPGSCQASPVSEQNSFLTNDSSLESFEQDVYL